MKRRSFFGTLLALVTARFAVKAVAPEGLAFRKDAFKMAMEPLGSTTRPRLTINRMPSMLFPFKPFAEFDAPIEAMATIKSNASDDMLLVISGGIGYIVDKHGVAKRL